MSIFILCFTSNITVFAESNSSDNLFGNKDDMKVFMDNTFQRKSIFREQLLLLLRMEKLFLVRVMGILI